MRQIVPRILDLCRNWARVVCKLWRKSPRFVSHTCSVARDLGILLARTTLVRHEEHVTHVGVRCPAEKEHRLPVEEIAIAWG